MNLLKIKIWNYKSIKQPIELDFESNRYLAIIGKNGSGKTNLLKAIKLAVSKNRNFRNEKNEGFQAEYSFRLTEEERKTYFSLFEDNDMQNSIITVRFDGDSPEAKKISAPILETYIKKFRTSLENITGEFRSAADEYITNLEKIELSDDYYAEYVSLGVKDEQGSLTQLRSFQLKQISDTLQRQNKDIENVLSIFAVDNFSLNEYDHMPLVHSFGWPIQFYEIIDNQIIISPIVAESLGINKENLKEATDRLNLKIKEVNERLTSSYKKIQEQIEAFESLKKEISAVFSKKEDEQFLASENLEKEQRHFIYKLRDTVFANCYYIDNEDSLLFHSNQRQDYERLQIREHYLNSRNPILEAIDSFLKAKHSYRDDESIIDYGKLRPERLKLLVDKINKKFFKQLIPAFDSDEIKGYELGITSSQLSLFVVEKDGTKTNVNNTSLGRRWFFTYKLITKLLKEGDYLLIDEPAAFLHPQAQTEIKQELEELSKKGIYVIYATHSPYLIPVNWDRVISLDNDVNGTLVKSFKSANELGKEIETELGDLHKTDILINLSKIVILVEGMADKACIKKFADLLGYNLSKYYLHVCDGDSIVQVSYICEVNGINFITLLDNDNKFKDKNYKSAHPNFQKCLNNIQNKQNVIFIGKGETGSLEDYFSTENNKFSYFERGQNKWKISKSKINSIKSKADVTEITLSNFEQLFKKIGLEQLIKK